MQINGLFVVILILFTVQSFYLFELSSYESVIEARQTSLEDAKKRLFIDLAELKDLKEELNEELDPFPPRSFNIRKFVSDYECNF
jgi:hypothetical protein